MALGLLALLVGVVSAGGTGSALAQATTPKRDTGRHRPVPVVRPAAESQQRAQHSETGNWFVGLAAGFTGGGDLWRVATVNDVPVPWRSAVSFTSSRFNATLANNFGAGIMVGHRLGDWGALRLDWHSARMDVTAEAPQGQKAGVFGYDRLTMTVLTLSGEVKLARIPSSPYISLGIVVNDISAAREKELDQSQVGYRLGLGYLRALSPDFSLRGEASYSRSGFDTGRFIPQTTFPTQSELEFQPANDLNLFEFVLALQRNF